ncbi:carboxymuconolactone decarboxylase family protein [Flavobacteriaceae bacterium S0825]|uniref:carboxymuconolactone decarboxylase family protein n=1 Tax=Gaetbulibacter sp. S0825 TaxID=2720084 RepID=UPI001FCB51A6|nr:carboxymuconolactone decarboxylase family protein [Gaetbulibacter sp. S0825]MCK0107892.1 carboxymuconolactone decarboxylase family protein [Flavobacteriaceae bacterium S0825]
MSNISKLALEPKTIETADFISAKILEAAKKGMGMIPNMYATMANNTALFDAYSHSYKTFRENAGFTSQEQEIIFLSIAFENECDYCMSAHSFVADKMSKVPISVTNAIRNNIEIEDAKYKALSIFSRVMTAKRGNPSHEDIEAFFAAGYTENHILGVIAGIGVKTMSNYFNHVFDTPVDIAFSSRKWVKPN